jgi:hypothetical protein
MEDKRLENALKNTKINCAEYLEKPTQLNENKVMHSVKNFSHELYNRGHYDRAREYAWAAHNIEKAETKPQKVKIVHMLSNTLVRMTIHKVVSMSIGVIGTAALLSYIISQGTVIAEYDTNYDGYEDIRAIDTGNDMNVDYYLQDTDFNGVGDTIRDSSGSVEASGWFVEFFGNLFQ